MPHLETKKYFQSFHWQPGEAGTLYLGHFLRGLALSLPGIFVPIFIFNLANKPVIHSSLLVNNLVWAVFYYLAYAFFLSLCHLLLTDFLFRKFGFKNSIFFSNLFLIGAVSSWLAAETNFVFVFLAAFLAALAVHFYWIPFHILFVRKANRGGNFGEESAAQLLWVSLAGALGPLTAGLIIKVFGFDTLFFLTLGLLLVASLPILFFIHEHQHQQHQIKNIINNYALNPDYRKTTLAFAGKAVEGMLYDIFWPILLFLLLADFAKIGFLVTASIAVSILIMFLIGRVIEKQKAGFFQKESVLVNTLLYLPRIFLTNPLGAYLIDVVDRLNGNIYSVSFIAEVYDKAKFSQNESDFVVYQETVSHFSQFLVLLLALGILFFVPNWKMVFLLAAIGSGFSYFIFIPKGKSWE
ncbi:MAG: hypothetical protein AB1721_00280 [Patescibacteria group bacterium]